MSANKRDTTTRAADLPLIARLYLRGESQAAIALALTERNQAALRARLAAGAPPRPPTPDELEACALTQQQISYDLKALRARWVAEATIDFSERVSVEVAKIDRLEVEYNDAWERSKQPKQTKSGKNTQRDKASIETSLKTEDRDGNPIWLEGVQRCIEMRCKLLGLNAAALMDVRLGPQTRKNRSTGSDEPVAFSFRWMTADEADEQMRAATAQQSTEQAALL